MDSKNTKKNPNDLSHEWKSDSLGKFEYCKKCGIVRRRDRQNRHCRGRVKIGLRSSTNPRRGGKIV